MNRELANKWEGYEGAVKVWMLPYKRFGFAEAYNQLMDGKYDNDAAIFAVIDWVLVDAEIASLAPGVWRSLKLYLGKRKAHDLKGNWTLFQELCSVTLIEELNIAYEETRDKLISDTYYQEVSNEADPKA